MFQYQFQLVAETCGKLVKEGRKVTLKLVTDQYWQYCTAWPVCLRQTFEVAGHDSQYHLCIRSRLVAHGDTTTIIPTTHNVNYNIMVQSSHRVNRPKSAGMGQH